MGGLQLLNRYEMKCANLIYQFSYMVAITVGTTRRLIIHRMVLQVASHLKEEKHDYHFVICSTCISK